MNKSNTGLKFFHIFTRRQGKRNADIRKRYCRENSQLQTPLHEAVMARHNRSERLTQPRAAYNTT